MLGKGDVSGKRDVSGERDMSSQKDGSGTGGMSKHITFSKA
jgi:hypothetical protein